MIQFLDDILPATFWDLCIPEPNSGCWLWLGFLVKEHGHWRGTTAQRAVIQAIYGKVPDGWHVDHLCRVEPCVNPAHLDIVTHAENIRRGHAHRRDLHLRAARALALELLATWDPATAIARALYDAGWRPPKS